MHSPFHGGTQKMTLRKVSMRNRILAAPAMAALALGPEPLRGQDATPLASPGATPVTSEDLPTEQVAMLTGPEPSINYTWEQWEVYGTDLGSSFMFGDEMYIVFGDTFAAGNSDWRSNVLAVSTDDDPRDGIIFDRMITDREGHAKEILPS